MKNLPEQNRRHPGSVNPPALPQKRSRVPASDWAEKRSHKRIDISTEISFQSESNFYTGFTADISSGGVFVVTWDTVPIGSHISLTFSLPNLKESLQVEGVVRWVREHNPTDPDLWPGMGIQFQTVDSRVLQFINKFVEAREPIFYDD